MTAITRITLAAMTALAFVLLSGFSSYGASCPRIVGAERLFADRSVSVVTLSGGYETDNGPALFSSLVCAALQNSRRVRVIVDQPADRQASLDAFMTSDGKELATVHLMRGLGWGALHKNEATSAMLSLLQQLRAWTNQKKLDGVLPLVPPHYEGQIHAIAEALEGLSATQAHTLLLVYLSPENEPVADHLNRKVAVSLTMESGHARNAIAWRGERHMGTLETGTLSKSPPAFPNQLAPDIRKGLQKVFTNLDQAEARYAGLSNNLSITDRLLELGHLDQAGRFFINEIDFAEFRDRGQILSEALAARLEPVDDFDLAEVLRLLPPEGWFSITRYGRDAALSAFHIVNHGDLVTQRRVFPALEEFARMGEADPDLVGVMYDKMAVAQDKPQRYGTQFVCKNGKFTQDIEDPMNVDARRKALGMTFSYAETRARAQAAILNPPCPR